MAAQKMYVTPILKQGLPAWSKGEEPPHFFPGREAFAPNESTLSDPAARQLGKSGGMAASDEVSRFIRSSFRSVWSFELLMLLKREQRRWPHAEIVARLRASDLVVTQSVDSLAAAGLVDLDERGAIAYAPLGDREGRLVDEAEQFYATRPDHVRRLIVGAATGGLTAFADAFRIRKD